MYLYKQNKKSEEEVYLAGEKKTVKKRGEGRRWTRWGRGIRWRRFLREGEEGGEMVMVAVKKSGSEENGEKEARGKVFTQLKSMTSNASSLMSATALCTPIHLGQSMYTKNVLPSN